jgi:histidine ammonia-lyase
VRALSTIVGVELICAGRALRLQGRTPREFTNPRFRKALDAALSLPADVQDRDLKTDVDAAVRLVMLPEFG